MASFAANLDAKRESERLKSVFSSARAVAGLDTSGKSPISAIDLKNMEHARAGLAGLQRSPEGQNPAAQAFSPQKHRIAAPTIRFAGSQVRDMAASAVLNMVAPGVGTIYGVLATVRSAQNGIGSQVMPTSPQMTGSAIGSVMGSFADQADKARGIVPSRMAQKGHNGVGGPKPGRIDIMAAMRPDESAAQIRMQETAAHFNQVIDQKAAGLNKLTQGGNMDLSAQGMMSDRAWQVMDPTRADQIWVNGGFGNLSDAGLDAQKIKELATRRHIPTRTQQMALAPAFG